MAAVLLTQPWPTVAGNLPRVEPSEIGLRAENLDRILPAAQEQIDAGEFAGCVVAIGRHGKLGFLEAIGHRQLEPERLAMQTDTVFDLASLTKPIATATSVFLLIERGQVRLQDRLKRHVPDLSGEGSETITVEHLLTHHAGYVPDNALADYLDGPDESWRRLLALDVQAPPGTRFKYSDVGFEMLGLLVERVSGKPVDQFAKENVFEPLGMRSTTYNPGPDLRQRAAASEPRDGEMLIGVVHDPRAALLDGVAGHAGLFSTAEDLAIYAQMLLNGGQHDGVRILGLRTIQEMTRARDVSGHRRTAGWDARSGFSSNRSELFTDRAFGHGGFTGTAIWIDPGLDLFVIVLSNRLHPNGRGSVNHLAGRIGTIAAGAIVDP